MNDEEPYDIHLKVLMLGDGGTGKTSLLLRYAESKFQQNLLSTIGIDFKVKHILVDGLRTKLQIWDTAGQERFRAITTSYFKGSHACMLVYDVTDRESFLNINTWTRQIRDHGDLNTNILLVANKCDDSVNRNVSTLEGQKLAGENNVTYLEVSAKTNFQVVEAFNIIAVETKRRLLGEAKDLKGINLKEKSNFGCC